MQQYEYAVIRDGDDPGDLHRGPWPKATCEEWVKEWEDMNTHNNVFREGMFKVVRRPVGPWEVADG